MQTDRRSRNYTLRIEYYILQCAGTIVSILIAVVLLTGSSPAQNQRLLTTNSDLLATKWTTEEGLPQNTVTSIVQTKDGFIWLGTFGGLARFDGVKFTVFDSTNAPGLTSNRILALYEDRWQRLWVGAESGEVFTLIDGRFVEWRPDPTFQRVTVWQFIEDGDGNFFIASDSGLERFSFDDNGEVIPGSLRILSRSNSYKLAKDTEGAIWTTFNSAYVVSGDELLKADTFGPSFPKNIVKIDFSSMGKMFVGTVNSLGWLENGNYTEFLRSKRGNYFGSYAATFRSDELWFQYGHELYEFRGGNPVVHDLSNYVNSGSRAIFFDRENNLWLATEADGLVRLRRRHLDLIGDLTDFEVKGRFAVAEDAEGAVWTSGQDLLKVQNGTVERFKIPKRGGGSQLIKALAFDKNNVMWAGGTSGLFIVRNGAFFAVPEFASTSIHSLFFDRHAALWIGTANGLWNFKDDKATFFSTKDGLAANSIHFITQTKDETIWIGTIGGVSKFKDGKFESLTSRDGLSGNYVRDILEDDEGTVWIATYGGGINRLRDGKIRVITSAQGLHDNFVSRILVGDDGKFWILGNLGIFAVARDDLNAVADSNSRTLVGSVYGVPDGMISSEASGGHQPAGVKTRDGRLWFPMIDDVVIVDPKKIDSVSPKILIERVSSTAGVFLSPLGLHDVTRSLNIDPGGGDLDIQFTGLNFAVPERIRFFYKLEGLDTDWVDAGSRRTASYPYIPSGNYVFVVKAVNADGVWSEETASLAINVAKSFWQTWWFITSFFVAVMLAGFLLYNLRLQQLEERNRKQKEFLGRLINAHEVERQRLASELHDGLGQNLLIIKNWAHPGMNDMDNSADARLSQISETATNAIEETRAIVKNLTPQNLKRFGLTAAIGNMIEQLEDSTGVVFESKLENIDRLYSEEAEISIYRIVQEGLNNIIKHSESPRGRVEIRRFDSSATILIQDFGKGFSINKNDTDGFDSNGFGLQSITERVRFLDGKLSIDSVPGEGTKIFIDLRK